MTDPKAVKAIPGAVTKIDIETGKETHEPMTWTVIPPDASKCQVCAQTHEPGEPHNANTMFYQILFYNMVGRNPTWADAMAHCDDETKRKWTTELKRQGHWSEPPAGEKPVAHHGVG